MAFLTDRYVKALSVKQTVVWFALSFFFGGGFSIFLGRWFDSRWCRWNFSLTILPIALWPWGRLSLYQKWVAGEFPGGKCGRCVRLTSLPPPCALVMKSGNLNFLEPSGPLQACNGTDLPFPFSLSYWCKMFISDLYYTSENRSEIPRRFLNVVLKKDV